MSTIKRDQLLVTFKGVNGKLKMLKSKPKPVYTTSNKFIPGVGTISELNQEKEIALGYAKVNSEIATIKSAASELGISLNEKDYMFMGFDLSVWNSEFKTRLEEIRTKKEIKQLEATKTKLSKYLSEEDLFQYEMGGLGLDLTDLANYADKDNSSDSDDIILS